jgi:hypothetical protein
MQLSRRFLVPGELDHELVALSFSLSSVALAAAWLAIGLAWPRCLFQDLTGHPCPTCGATRSAIAFFHGEFFAAWKWNPLAFLFYCGLSMFDAYAFVVLVTGAPRVRIANLTANEKGFLRVTIVALVALNWIYLLIAKPSL